MLAMAKTARVLHINVCSIKTFTFSNPLISRLLVFPAFSGIFACLSFLLALEKFFWPQFPKKKVA